MAVTVIINTLHKKQYRFFFFLGGGGWGDWGVGGGGGMFYVQQHGWNGSEILMNEDNDSDDR